MNITDAMVEAAALSDATFDGRDFPALGAADKRRYRDRARAALTAALSQDEWQPIETAEKTSRSRLVWVPYNRCTYCVSWREGNAEDGPGGWTVFGGGWRDMIQGATHWRPLPAPPIPTQEEG